MVPRRFEFGNDPLVHAAPRCAIDRGRIRALDGHAILTSERQRFCNALIRARANAHAAHAAASQRFEHGIDAVDDHEKC
jgi:hypothetical protein